MSLFEDIKAGLLEAIEYTRGNIEARVTKFTIAPIQKFSASEIIEIRNSTGLSQFLFSCFMGVTIKTVESWESGKTKPSGTACRMLELTKQNPNLPKSSNIINIEQSVQRNNSES